MKRLTVHSTSDEVAEEVRFSIVDQLLIRSWSKVLTLGRGLCWWPSESLVRELRTTL